MIIVLRIIHPFIPVPHPSASLSIGRPLAFNWPALAFQLVGPPKHLRSSTLSHLNNDWKFEAALPVQPIPSTLGGPDNKSRIWIESFANASVDEVFSRLVVDDKVLSKSETFRFFRDEVLRQFFAAPVSCLWA